MDCGLYFSRLLSVQKMNLQTGSLPYLTPSEDIKYGEYSKYSEYELMFALFVSLLSFMSVLKLLDFIPGICTKIDHSTGVYFDIVQDDDSSQ